MDQVHPFRWHTHAPYAVLVDSTLVGNMKLYSTLLYLGREHAVGPGEEQQAARLEHLVGGLGVGVRVRVRGRG